MSVYNKYRVLNVEFEYSVFNTYFASSSAPVLSLYPSNVNAAVATWKLAAEQPFSEMCTLGIASCPPIRNTKSYNIAAILGYRENVDEDLSAQYNANPV